MAFVKALRLSLYLNVIFNVFRLEDSVRKEIGKLEQTINLIEEFDQELYAQSEVLDNLEQTLECQNFPWNLAESGETCTLMVGWPKIIIEIARKF